jgi:hypothetical protein
VPVVVGVVTSDNAVLEAGGIAMERPEREIVDFGATFKRFLEEVVERAPQAEDPIRERVADHVGVEPARLPVVSEDFEAWDQPNLQLALDAYLGANGRRHELVGIASDTKSYAGIDLADLIARRAGSGSTFAEGSVDYVNIDTADGSLACINFGLLLIHDGSTPLVALVGNTAGRQMRSDRPLRLQVMAPDIRAAQRTLREIRDHMDRLDIYRGNVISLEMPRQGPYILPGTPAAVLFHRFPTIPRQNVILPDGLLDRLEQHTAVFAEHSAELVRLGRSLKRGILLYGPPGTGKTHTVMYLSGLMAGRTVVLVTGRFQSLISTAAALARRLAPSMLVLEDVDLVAEDRAMRSGEQLPLLFELLNEMEGLREDADVIFLLTTNRAEVLEPALASRPGRIDLAVELPLPDADGRRRLLHLYTRGLTVTEADLEAFVPRTEGVSPAFIKEFIRKAVLLSATAGNGGRIERRHFDTALAELTASVLTRRLLGAEQPTPPRPASPLHAVKTDRRPD